MNARCNHVSEKPVYLYRLRPILLKKDSTNFDKVCRILSRKVMLVVPDNS
jgi:hypothetical protein